MCLTTMFGKHNLRLPDPSSSSIEYTRRLEQNEGQNGFMEGPSTNLVLIRDTRTVDRKDTELNSISRFYRPTIPISNEHWIFKMLIECVMNNISISN